MRRINVKGMEQILDPLRMRTALLCGGNPKVLSQPGIALIVQTLGNPVVEVSGVVFVLVTLQQRFSDILVQRDWRFSPRHSHPLERSPCAAWLRKSYGHYGRMIQYRSPL